MWNSHHLEGNDRKGCRIEAVLAWMSAKTRTKPYIFLKKRTFFAEPLDFFTIRCYNKDNHAAKDRNPTGLSFM